MMCVDLTSDDAETAAVSQNSVVWNDRDCTPSHVWNDRDTTSSHVWTIVSENVVSQAVQHGTRFLLCRGDVTLSIAVRQLPHFLLRATSRVDNVFALRYNAETSV